MEAYTLVLRSLHVLIQQKYAPVQVQWPSIALRHVECAATMEDLPVSMQQHMHFASAVQLQALSWALVHRMHIVTSQ